MHAEYHEPELDRFIAAKIMGDMGIPAYTSSMAEAWKLVEKMIRQYHIEIRLDVFLGVSGQNWRASFYSPSLTRRFEGRGKSAPLAICRAAKAAFLDLADHS